MLSDFTPWLTAIGGLLGLLAVVGAAFAVLKTNVTARTIQLWQEQSAALEVRLDEEKSARVAADAQRVKDLARIDVAEAQNAKCEERLSALERVVGDAMKARAPRKRAT